MSVFIGTIDMIPSVNCFPMHDIKVTRYKIDLKYKVCNTIIDIQSKSTQQSIYGSM